MNILFISHSSALGGAENNLYELLSGLKGKINCYCIFPSHGPLEEKVAALGIPTFVTKMKWWIGIEPNATATFFGFFEDLKERVEIIQEIISKNKIDLVFTNTIVVGEGALAAKVLNVPHIWRIAEILSADPGFVVPFDLALFYRIVIALSSTVLVVANAVKKEFENVLGCDVPNIEVVYDGIEMGKRQFSFKLSMKNKLVLAAGNICRRKGFMAFLEAAALVKKKVPGAKFRIAGNITEKEYYSQMLKKRKQKGLNEDFEFVGFQKDIYRVLEECRVFVLSSTCEPLGTVVLEAMSAGRPVVVTDSGGPAEIVEDQISGFVVPVNNPEIMAQRIVCLLEDEDMAYRMGRAAFDRIGENFTKGKFISECLDIIMRTSKKESVKFDLNMIIDILDSFGAQRFKGKLENYDKITNSKLCKIAKYLLKQIKRIWKH